MLLIMGNTPKVDKRQQGSARDRSAGQTAPTERARDSLRRPMWESDQADFSLTSPLAMSAFLAEAIKQFSAVG